MRRSWPWRSGRGPSGGCRRSATRWPRRSGRRPGRAGRCGVDAVPVAVWATRCGRAAGTDALADAVGPASVVGSANALVAGAPTRAAATSRVPARRSRAPRVVVGVDIGAFLSGSRRDARTTGSPGHSGSVPHSSTVLWSRSHLPGIPTRRDVTSRPTAAGQCRTWTGFPRTGACGAARRRRPDSTPPGGGPTPGSAPGQNGGGSSSWRGARRRVRRQGQCSVVSTSVGVRVGGFEEGDAVDGQDLGAVVAVVVAPGGHGVGVGGRRGGAVWCSRWNSRSLWGPSGRVVRARLVLPGAAAGAAAGVVGSAGVVTAGRTLVCRASAGWVVRTRPVGSVQVATPSGVSTTFQPGSLFDPVVAPAQGEQVGVSGGSVGPGSDVVEVAEDGGDGAAGEAAAPVAGLDPFRGSPVEGRYGRSSPSPAPAAATGSPLGPLRGRCRRAGHR